MSGFGTRSVQTLRLEQIQLDKFNELLAAVWERNPFYTHKWCQAGVAIHQAWSLENLKEFPLTTRSELLADQAATPPLGSNLTSPYSALKRIHRSSGSTRAPLFWGDTSQSWNWVMRCSQALYRMAGIDSGDRLFFALPFGASSGPWIMYEGASSLGCCCVSGGSADLTEQLFYLRNFQPTVVVGRPLHLRSLAVALQAQGMNPEYLGVEKLIFTGESAPPNLRLELEFLWDVECFDRYGLTEAGPVAGECPAHPFGMHLLETEYIAEVIDPETTQPVSDGEEGELVLTTLGRWSQPIIRYRTGDRVRLVRSLHCACGRPETLLLGGVSRHVTEIAPQTSCPIPRLITASSINKTAGTRVIP